MSTALAETPLHVFRFRVDFFKDALDGSDPGADRPVCSGAFAECTGLEATMEPKVIKEGGGNYGPSQRVGPVSFSTVVLKRGMTTVRDLWSWFEMINNQGSYAYRLAAVVNVYSVAGEAVLAWRLERALPVKFKAADLNAKGTDIGIEELHLAHEGLTLVAPTHPKL